MTNLKEINCFNLSALCLPSHDDLDVLLQVYKVMFNECVFMENLSISVQKYGTVTLFGQQFGSKMAYRSKRSTGIIASWPKPDGGINLSGRELIFGFINFYFNHSLKLNGEYKSFVFACVTWHRSTTDTIYNGINPLCGSVSWRPIKISPSTKIGKSAFALAKNENGEGRYISTPLVQQFCVIMLDRLLCRSIQPWLQITFQYLLICTVALSWTILVLSVPQYLPTWFTQLLNEVIQNDKFLGSEQRNSFKLFVFYCIVSAEIMYIYYNKRRKVWLLLLYVLLQHCCRKLFLQQFQLYSNGIHFMNMHVMFQLFQLCFISKEMGDQEKISCKEIIQNSLHGNAILCQWKFTLKMLSVDF